MTYTNSTAITSTRPSTRKNDLSAPIQAPTPSPETMDSASWTSIALVGVWYFGLTFASGFGSDPPLAIRYHIRVPTFAVARQTAITVLRNASSKIHQTPPQNLCASTRPGRSDDPGSELSLLTPQPRIWPQYATMSNTPRMSIDSIVARGTFRLGSRVSSASGAAPSQPVRPCTENTTARAKPSSESFLVKSNTLNVKPPGPGLANPHIERTKTMIISSPPSTSIACAEILMPRCWRNAMSGAPTRTHTHHSQGTLIW